MIADTFNKLKGEEFSGSFYKLAKISIKEKKDLGNMPLSINENTTINDENFLKAAMLDKDWPDGRALYVGKSPNGDRTFLMKINYVDHLEILIDQKKITHIEEIEIEKPPDKNSTDGKPTKAIERRYTYDFCNIYEGYKKLCEVTALIEKTCKFSQSEQLGFLTTLPRDLGFFEMNIGLNMPILYKMMSNSGEPENFAHFKILESYQVDMILSDKDGYMEIRPKDINHKKVKRAHNLKLDSFEEPFLSPNKSFGMRYGNTKSSRLMYPNYYDLKTDKRFNRFNKNEKRMVQDVISCVKELTDQENTYNSMQELYITYSKASKYSDIS